MTEIPSGFIEFSQPVHNSSIPPGCNISVSVAAAGEVKHSFCKQRRRSAPSKQRDPQVGCCASPVVIQCATIFEISHGSGGKVGKIDIGWIEDRLTGSVPLNVSLEKTSWNDCAVMKDYPESRISILDRWVSQCKLRGAGGLVLKKLGLEKTYHLVLESNALHLVASNSKWKDFLKECSRPKSCEFLEKGLCMKK